MGLWLLGQAVQAGQDPDVFKKDGDLVALKRNKKFKAVLRMKPPEPEAPEPQKAEEPKDEDEDSDDDEDSE